jgi:glyoxylase-like metal-dependent hydrolase (beta-lactamase superfamily II)
MEDLMKIQTFFDAATYTLTYIVYDEKSKDAIVIDPVLDYDPHASKISFESNNKVEKFVKDNNLNLIYALETHAHADHLSGSPDLKKRFPKLKVGISQNITQVQEVFKGVFNFKDLKTDGSQFDFLLKNNEAFKAGSLEVKVIETPGHTPACTSFLIGDAVFTGDALFMPDYGTGRCDFPAGSAENLYHSIHEKLYNLPDNTRVFVGHDYQPEGREVAWETSIGESKEKNIQLKESTRKEDFVTMRTSRDATLKAPRLLLQSVQVNINAGEFPEKEDNGKSYLKMPIK